MKVARQRRDCAGTEIATRAPARAGAYCLMARGMAAPLQGVVADYRIGVDDRNNFFFVRVLTIPVDAHDNPNRAMSHAITMRIES